MGWKNFSALIIILFANGYNIGKGVHTMATVNSVLGPIDTDKLGFTLMHEHLMVSSAGIPQVYDRLLGDDYVERMVQGLKKAKAGGVDTIVDATTFDLGRDVTVMAEASRRSGVNIIAVTGWWMELPRFLVGLSADQFADLFTREIEEGIAGTGIKAGLLKAASDSAGVLPAEEEVLRGVARAHRRTGVPIMLHSYSPGQVGRQQIAILREEGIDLRHVKLDHSNDTTDVEYLTWILEQGCYLGLDRYPGRITSSQARTRTMKALIDAGWAHRLLPSHDYSLLWLRLEGLPQNSPMSPEEREKRNPHGYLYIKKVVFPQLKKLGVPEAVLNRLCVEGPKNFFEGK
jgi:phosphotriesterase-related protein